MPQCFDNMYQLGDSGPVHNFSSVQVPDVAVDICPGDFLTANTATTGVTKAARLQDFPWTTNLTTTRTNAKAAFLGVSMGEVGTEECIEQRDDLPYARYVGAGTFRRSYKIMNDSGVATPTTWQANQLFTFAKNPSSNALLPNCIVKTSDPAVAVFRAPKASGPEVQGRALVEFYTDN